MYAASPPPARFMKYFSGTQPFHLVFWDLFSPLKLKAL